VNNKKETDGIFFLISANNTGCRRGASTQMKRGAMMRNRTLTLGEILAVIAVLGASATALFPRICRSDRPSDDHSYAIAGFASGSQADMSQ
jgi:hypothetical protein